MPAHADGAAHIVAGIGTPPGYEPARYGSQFGPRVRRECYGGPSVDSGSDEQWHGRPTIALVEGVI